MSYSVYRINLPESPEVVVFVNGFVARDRAGFFWIAKGCMQVKAGICGLNEVIMVSYWVPENSLKKFF